MSKLDNILRDSLSKSKQRVRFLKLDVEGAEIDVLRGAENSINGRQMEYVYVEVHEKQIRIKGQDPKEVHDILVSRGFKIAEKLGQHAFLYKTNVQAV